MAILPLDRADLHNWSLNRNIDISNFAVQSLQAWSKPLQQEYTKFFLLGRQALGYSMAIS